MVPRQFQWRPLLRCTLKKGQTSARIQVKLQRLEGGTPKLYYPQHYPTDHFLSSRCRRQEAGRRSPKRYKWAQNQRSLKKGAITVNTRPYSFGDFDILAVNMHPSTGNWREFRYTVASWLLPRAADTTLIEIFQPVASTPNDAWTDDLDTCLKSYELARQFRVLTELLHLKKSSGTPGGKLKRSKETIEG